MRIIADLHVHSKYARGCSPRMDLEGLSRLAKIKGIDLVGSGDFTHEKYFEEIKEAAGARKDGIFEHNGVNFIPTVETNNLFEGSDGKRHRIHCLVVMGGIGAAKEFSEVIAPKSKLGTDGRPWVRLSLAEMCEKAIAIDKKALIIPAHIWTPWYGAFGAKSGFDSLSEAFDGQEKNIHAIETGLSSDPAMNWRCSWLDDVRLLSFSDAHSPEKLGREASVFELEEFGYDALYDAIAKKGGDRLSCTYEFFPQEGKYYSDGHADCGVRTTAEETLKYGGRCPKCGKRITKGVLGRIGELADRKEGEKPASAVPYKSLVPLQELIAMALGVGLATKKPVLAYEIAISAFGSEYGALFAEPADIEAALKVKFPRAHAAAIAKAVDDMQNGRLEIKPGYDGQFGIVGLKKS